MLGRVLSILLLLALAATATPMQQEGPGAGGDHPADAAPPESPGSADVGGQDDVDGFSLTASQQQWLDDHPEIRLGPYANYAPAQFVDDEGRHRGIAADYVARIEQLIGHSFTSVKTETWQELLDKTRSREIDVIAMAAETKERLDYLRFTQPYLTLPAVIIAKTDVTSRLTPKDLAGMRVAVVQGYAVHDYLRDTYPDIVLDPVPDTRAGLRKVSFGMVDAFITDLAVGSFFITQEGITNLHVVGESGYTYEMGFAIRSDWPELVGILDRALAAIPADEREAIFNEWIHLSHEAEFASQRLLRWLLIAAIAIAVLTAVFIVWNRSLARLVSRRTDRLQNELQERRKVERALRQSERRVLSIINSALDSVITMDERGRITGWSKQAETDFGYTRDEAVGKDLADLIIPEAHRKDHRAGLDAFKHSHTGPVIGKRIEINALRNTGEEFPVELSIAAIRRDDQYEFSAFVRDITVRRQQEEELKAHRERLEELVTERTEKMRMARDEARAAESELAVRISELEQALAEVKQLRGLLPICSYCKRIREGDAYHRSVEQYLTAHSDTTFSHGVCPDCYEQHVKPKIERLG